MTVPACGKNYFGEDGLPLTVVRVNSNARHRHDLSEVEHFHDFAELMVITEGRGIHTIEGLEYPVSAGDAFLLQGNQTHYFHSRRNMTHTNIMFDPARLPFPWNQFRKMSGFQAFFILEPSYRSMHNFKSRLHLGLIELEHVEASVQLMEKELQERNPGFEAVLIARLTELIVYLSRRYSDSKQVKRNDLLRIGEVIGTIEQNLKFPWRLKQLAEIACMSESNLLRVFRKATGKTPVQYLLHLRVQRAMELLRTGIESVAEVASATGFTDSNYFSRQFRKITGKAPTAYRQSIR